MTRWWRYPARSTTSAFARRDEGHETGNGPRPACSFPTVTLDQAAAELVHPDDPPGPTVEQIAAADHLLDRAFGEPT